MRVASIICENLDTAKEQIQKVSVFCDVIELRLDFLKEINIELVQQLRAEIKSPVIFTLRKKSQGGQCDFVESERLALIQKLAQLKPDYFDLEFDITEAFVVSLKQQNPTLQIIGSYHDFKQTPPDLTKLFQSIHKPYFDITKIATFANNLCDTLRLLIFLKKTSQQQRVIGMAMGEYGQASRILSPIVGSLMTYGVVDESQAAAPGQLTLQEMAEVYCVQVLNRDTVIYALLGFPVAQSPGHLFHNQKFNYKNRNAVYVKLKVAPEELAEAMSLFRQLPFAGFSVTIPHKETVSAFLDELEGEAKAINTVNTIKYQDGKYLGFNTDGVAAASILKEKINLQNKQILILGAGGSAKAIAHALINQGAKITFCNRTIARAKALTVQCPGEVIDFTQLFVLKELPYDVMINTLPADAFIEQCANWQMLPAKAGSIAMDIVLNPLDTLFLKLAGAAGYLCIAGDALYKEQALRQLKIWNVL